MSVDSVLNFFFWWNSVLKIYSLGIVAFPNMSCAQYLNRWRIPFIICVISHVRIRCLVTFLENRFNERLVYYIKLDSESVCFPASFVSLLKN